MAAALPAPQAHAPLAGLFDDDVIVLDGEDEAVSPATFAANSLAVRQRVGRTESDPLLDESPPLLPESRHATVAPSCAEQTVLSKQHAWQRAWQRGLGK